jgi:putative ABC transport system permease protein
MLKNYFNIAWRNLEKNRFFSLINVVGLSTGIAACLLIFFFIRHENGFDTFQGPGVYRLLEVQQNEGADNVQKVARTMFPMGPTLKQEFSGIADFARLHSVERAPLQRPGKATAMAVSAGADASFLRIFNLKLVNGDASTALEKPGSIIVTEELAAQLFDSENPLGQVLRSQGRDTVDYTITGVFSELPQQSHLHVDALYSFSTELIEGESADWHNDWVFTYLALEEGGKPRDLEARFPAYLQKYLGSERARQYELFLQPVADAHLWSDDITQDVPGMRKFSGEYLPVLAVVALLVLALAIINYVNLTTARSITRAREIAVRRTIGARRMQIISQFIAESLLVTLVAATVALALADLFLPLLTGLTGMDNPIHIWDDSSLLAIAGATAIGSGLLAGFLPAISVARIRPVTVLKGHHWTSARSPLRSALVVAQFAIAVVLSVASVSAFMQLKFMQQYDLGFNNEEVLVTQVSWTERHRVEAMMNELRQIRGVQAVTGSLRRLGSPIDQGEIVFQDEDRSHQMQATTMYVDYNYIPFYQIDLLAGRNISPRFTSDALGNSYIINESMAKKLLALTTHPRAPLSYLIGKPFRYSFQDQFGTIIGITRDFNFNSLHNSIEPLCITYEFDYYFKELSIRIDPRHRSETLQFIQEKWQSNLPDQPFEYYFLDDYMDRMYKADTQLGQLVACLTLLALVISGLGLVGLAAYNTERRTKEIGIRKVLGASVQRIVAMLSADFLKLVIIAVIIAIPVGWYAVSKWLENFAFRIPVNGWMFFTCGFAVIVLALVTVSFQTVRAALLDPVKSLRSE